MKRLLLISLFFLGNASGVLLEAKPDHYFPVTRITFDTETGIMTTHLDPVRHFLGRDWLNVTFDNEHAWAAPLDPGAPVQTIHTGWTPGAGEFPLPLPVWLFAQPHYGLPHQWPDQNALVLSNDTWFHPVPEGGGGFLLICLGICGLIGVSRLFA